MAIAVAISATVVATGGGARRCAPRPARDRRRTGPRTGRRLRRRGSGPAPAARALAGSCRRAGRRAKPRRRRPAGARGRLGVEAVEVRVAARVDPDALGGERRRLGARLLQRVDGGGDLAGDLDRRRRAQRAVGQQRVQPAAGRRLRRRRRRGPRACACRRRRAGAGGRPRRAGGRARGSARSRASRADRPTRTARPRALARVLGAQYGGICVLSLDGLDPVAARTRFPDEALARCH